MRRAVVSLALALIVGIGVPGAAPARAEELPPLVRALDGDDAAARARAIEALRGADDGGAMVSAAFFDEAAFASLTARGQVALLQLAAESDASFVNARMRKIVRDTAAEPAVRRAAVDALAVYGGIADVRALRGVLPDYPEAAAKALALIGGRSAETALRAAAGEGAHPAILAALVRLGDDSPLRGLVASMASSDAAQRTEVGHLLNWATERDLPPEQTAWEAHLRRRSLAKQLAAEEIETAQTAAQELAAILASGTSASVLSDLIAIVRDARWPGEARNGAALALGLGGAREAKDALLDACRNKEEGALRLYAADALARVGDLSCAVTLADRLVHDEDRDRIKARRQSTGEYFPVDPAMASALLRYGCPGAVGPLLDVLAGSYRTRMGRDTLRTLRAATGGPDFGYEPDSTQVQRDEAVARARAWWFDGREAMGLVAAADDPGWPVFREQVAERIELLGAFKFLHQLRAKKALIIVAEPALPQLLAALQADDLHIRMGAAEVLRGATLRAAGPALAASLADESNAAARSKFVWALEVCGRPDAAGAVPAAVRDAVRAALDDASIDVRIAAARTLGVVGEGTLDTPLLLAARGRPENAVTAFRAASAASAVALVHRAVMADLVWELRSDDVARRAEAADALRRAGLDMHGYDPDATEEARGASIDAILKSLGVSAGERR